MASAARGTEPRPGGESRMGRHGHAIAPRAALMSYLPQGLLSIAAKTAQALKRRKLTIVTAESCTAGIVAAALSHANGATDILHGGFVCYTKAHKTKALGVSAALL